MVKKVKKQGKTVAKKGKRCAVPVCEEAVFDLSGPGETSAKAGRKTPQAVAKKAAKKTAGVGGKKGRRLVIKKAAACGPSEINLELDKPGPGGKMSRAVVKKAAKKTAGARGKTPRAVVKVDRKKGD